MMVSAAHVEGTDDRFRSPVAQLPSLPVAAPVVSVHATVSADASGEAEIMGIWTQCLQALFICWLHIGPVFAAAIAACYCFGKLSQSQAISSVGITLVLLLIMIMGSYCLVIVPFLLVAKVFTALVSPQLAQPGAQRELDFYVRSLMLFLILATAVVCSVAYKLRVSVQQS
jgi:hypothetical protein